MSTRSDSQSTNASNNMRDLLRGLLRQSGRRGMQGDELTHRSVDVIAHQLRITPVERILFWLSKTDLYALALCTHHTRLTLSGLGLMVLFTSMLALISGYSTLSLIIDPEIELRGAVAFIGAALYAYGIMLIDREIVGNPSHKALWIRMLFALLIATAVSYPIKLKLLDGPIKAEIATMVEERNAAKLERIDELRSRGLAEKTAQVKTKDEQLAGIKTSMAELQEQIRSELRRENGGKCRENCERFKAQLRLIQELEQSVIKEKEALLRDDALPANAQEEISRLLAVVDKQKSEAYDFLSYWQGQDRVMKKDQSGARVLSVFIFCFFLALELVPVGLKYSLGTSEYHQYLEARNRLNLQKIASVTNMMLEAMQNAESLEDILRMPPELSDLLAYLMEDSALPTQLDTQLREFFGGLASSEAKDPQAAHRESSRSGERTKSHVNRSRSDDDPQESAPA